MLNIGKILSVIIISWKIFLFLSKEYALENILYIGRWASFKNLKFEILWYMDEKIKWKFFGKTEKLL